MNLDVVFREAATEALLFSQVVRVVDGSEIRDPFFRFLAALCLDNLNAESRRQRIEKIYQAIAMILSQSSSASIGVKGAFDKEKPMGDREKRFEFAKKFRTIA